jgi:serine O-acetyltransferase
MRVADRLDHTNLPDPVVETFRVMQREINELRAEIERLKKEKAEAERKEQAEPVGTLFE